MLGEAPCEQVGWRGRPISRGKVVERGGFEPPKREARQIYSLLPLTTRPSLHAVTTAHAAGVVVLEPERGLEPLTGRLQIDCAANCATRAGSRNLKTDSNTKTIRGSGSSSKYESHTPQWQEIPGLAGRLRTWRCARGDEHLGSLTNREPARLPGRR